MSPAEYPAVLERCFNARDGNRLLELWAEDFSYEGPGISFTGKQQMLQQEQNLWTAFPDIRCDISPFVASHDRIVFETRMRGTHSGPLRLASGAAVPASGRSVDFTLSVHMSFRAGKIAGERLFYDTAGLLRQLGLARS